MEGTMSFQKLIDQQLLAEQEARKTREHSGQWIPSRFGRCYRFQFWARKNEPETNFPDLKMLRRWKVGSLYHKYAQSFFPKEVCEIKVTQDPDILGFADVVLGDKVIDIKSVSDWEFGYLIKPKYDIEKEKVTNCMQVCTYAWILKKPKASLVFIDTKSAAALEFDIRLEHFIPKIEEELKILREHWSGDKLPEPLPRAYGGKEGKYCGYCDKCLSMGWDCVNLKPGSVIS